MTHGSIVPPNKSPSEWLVVYQSYDSMDAHIVKGRLEHEGVPAMILSDPFGNAMGIHIGAIGIFRVLVAPKDFATAEAILAVNADDDDVHTLTDGDMIIIDDDLNDDQ